MTAKGTETAPTLLSLEQIAAVNDRPEIVVAVSEWGGAVKIRALTPEQINSARAKAWDGRKKETDESVLNAWCLSLGLVEPKVSFTVATQWFRDHAFGPVNGILAELMKASGLGKQAQEEAKSEPGAEPAA